MSTTDQVLDILNESFQAEEQEQETEEVTEEDSTEGQEEEIESEDNNAANDESASEEDSSPKTWSKALGIDDDKIVVDDEGNLKAFKVKADGEELEVSANDLIKSYQYHKHNVNQAQQVAEQRKQFDEITNKVSQDYLQKIDTAGKLTEYLNAKLQNDYKGIDWNRLRVENPAEYAAQMQDMQARQNELQQIYQAIEQEKQLENERASSKTQQAHNEYLKSQIDYALERNPEWKDQTIFSKALEDMSDFALKQYGVPKELFNSIEHAALFEVLKDAMKYHNGKTVATKKLEKPLPKFQKPTGKPVKEVSSLDKLISTAKSAKGHNAITAQTSAVTEMLKGFNL